MYSVGSLWWAARGPCWGLRSVRFMVDRKWLRKSRASSRGFSAAGLWGLMGLHELTHASVSSSGTSSLRMEQMERLMAEGRSGAKAQGPKTRRCVGDLQPSDGGLSSGTGQLAAVGDDQRSVFALVDLVVWSRGQGCSVLTCLEMSLWPRLALLSLDPPGETEQSYLT